MKPTALPLKDQLAEVAIKPKRVVNRPHWKDLCEELTRRNEKLEKEIERLRTLGADGVDISKIKSEAFAAGVAAASHYISK